MNFRMNLVALASSPNWTFFRAIIKFACMNRILVKLPFARTGATMNSKWCPSDWAMLPLLFRLPWMPSLGHTSINLSSSSLMISRFTVVLWMNMWFIWRRHSRFFWTSNLLWKCQSVCLLKIKLNIWAMWCLRGASNQLGPKSRLFNNGPFRSLPERYTAFWASLDSINASSTDTLQLRPHWITWWPKTHLFGPSLLNKLLIC